MTLGFPLAPSNHPRRGSREPRLRPASSLPINDIAVSQGNAGNSPFTFRSHGRQPARAEFASRRLAFPNIFR